MKMLAKPFFTALFLFSGAAAFAQLSLGLRGGINLATCSANRTVRNELGDPESRPVLLAGAVVELRLNDYLAIQPELNYLQKGFKTESSLTDPLLGQVAGKFEQTFHYLEIPVLVKGGAPFGPVRIDVLAGPSFGYALKANYTLTLKAAGKTNSETTEINFADDDVSQTDLGLQLGAAVSFSLGEAAKLFVDGRYLFGFTDLYTGQNDDAELRNRGIALSAGVLFSL